MLPTHQWRAVVASERMTEVAARIAQSDDRAAAAAEFWRTVTEGPLWERDPEIADAWRVTFLWQGAPELTHHVTLCGPVVFSALDDGGCPFARVPGTDIWHLTLRVPAQTRSTYAISPNGLLRT